MKFEYIGHACIRCISDSGKTLVLDPPEERYGYRLPDRNADYVCCSHDHGDHGAEELFPPAARLPREGLRLKAGPFSLERFPCWHDDQRGALRGSNLVQKITADGVTLVHLGDLGHWPDEALTRFARDADLLAVPVGGVFTLEPEQMLRVIALLHPAWVLPIHYRTPQCSLQQLHPLEDFLSLLAWEDTPGGGQLLCPPRERPREPAVILADYSSRIPAQKEEEA